MRLGLALSNSAIGVVAIKRRRVVHALTVEGPEQLATALKAELDSRRIHGRKARAGISRSLAIVKSLELPAVGDGALPQMLAFELQRHVPFLAEEACFGFARLPGPKEGPLRAMVAAAERRTVERALRLLEEAELRPLSLTVAAHDMIALVGRWSRTDRAVWLHRAGEEVTLLFLEGPHLRLSRSLPWGGVEALAEEIRKSLTHLRWDSPAGVWVSGDGSRTLETAHVLAGVGPVTPPPFSRAVSRRIADLGEAEGGLTLLALGVALGPRPFSPDLLPHSLRPRRLTPGQLTTAASIALSALLGLSVLLSQGYQDQRHLARLSQAIRALDPEVRAVEQLGAELEKKRQLLATARAFEASGLKPLPFLRELNEIIPADAWLNALSMDPRGVELTGQAAAASQLIPLLENSPRLEKVEFASPVTKGRDKEQFRIRASWETLPKPAQAPAPGATARGKARR